MNKVDHSITQTDLPLNLQVLNIALNLSRLSQWIYEGYGKRAHLVNKFLEQTDKYLNDLDKQNISKDFKPTLERVKKEFKNLKDNVKREDKLHWAEKALAWANILQHRARLA